MTSDLYRADLMQSIVSLNGPQIGEMVWHSIFVDDTIERINQEHADRIISIIRKHFNGGSRGLRCLELSSYVHYSMDMVAKEFGCETVISDISPLSLLEGFDRSNTNGFDGKSLRVVSDFHDMPFSDGYFDFVFIASAVHHTFRPGQVIEEIARITKPGGVIHIENEPVAREFCAYAYRGNRPDSATAFETALMARGLERTLSSAFYGSRAEALFGMIENDRIPLDLYLDAFQAAGDVVAMTLDTDVMISDFDRAILALPRDNRLPASIHAMLKAAFDGCAPLLGAADGLMGIRMLSDDELWLLSYRAARALKRLPAPSAPGYAADLARLFGAAMRATLRRRPAPGPAAGAMFRRDMQRSGPVWSDPLATRPRGLDLNRPLVPDGTFDDPGAFGGVFPADHWVSYREAIGSNSFLNRSANAEIRIDGSCGAERFCLLRFYAVGKPAPYAVEFEACGLILDRHVICQSESRLARMIVPPGAAAVSVRIRGLGGEETGDEMSLHVALIRLFAVRPEELGAMAPQAAPPVGAARAPTAAA